MGDTSAETADAPSAGDAKANDLPGQVVLVLQGGGALGAYQGGVYQALHEAGIEPAWVIGTSIGAINGAIIAGNPPELRQARLTRFWESVACRDVATPAWLPGVDAWLRNLSIFTFGIPSFFLPNPLAWFYIAAQLGTESAAFYSTLPLRETLLSTVDFPYLNGKGARLTVGCVNVGSGRMRYFGNRDTPLEVGHVMASAAFPPAFPPVRIDGESYWDGGIYSNTPIEAVLDDKPRRDSVIFAVQLWPQRGREPASIWQALARHRDIQYSSRAESQLARQTQIHKLRHVIRELQKYIPAAEQGDPAVQELLSWGCGTTMHVIELDAPMLPGDDMNKDIDFSAMSIASRWRAGYEDTKQVLEARPWRQPMEAMEGIAVYRTAPAGRGNEASAR